MFGWFTSLWDSMFGSKPSPSGSGSSINSNSISSTVSTSSGLSSSSNINSSVNISSSNSGERKMVKKALLVGINYVGTSSQLNGCVNDVILINQIIQDKFGFAKENSTDVRMLTDASATTKNILERLAWLIEGAKAGDVLLYHYSGHGVQMPSPDYSRHHEPDGLDECICPIDFDWRGNVIRDSDYRRIFANVPKGVNLTVISDSCHSGDVLRDMVNPMIQPSASPNRPRTMSIPPDIMNRGYGMDLKPKVRQIKNVNDDQIGILISGCRDTQTSADAWIQKTKKYHGALTYYMGKTLEDNRYDITYEDLVKKINQQLRIEGYEQEPQLDCKSELVKAKFLGSLV